MNDGNQNANTSGVQPPHTDWWGDHISDDRKAELRSHLAVWEDDSKRGDRLGPFDDVTLTGADVSWLPALIGAILDTSAANTKHKSSNTGPIARLLTYLNNLHLEGANLSGAHLEKAILDTARLEGANLSEAHLDHAFLSEAHLDRANLRGAHLKGTYLISAHLKWSTLSEAQLTTADLSGAYLEGANLFRASLDQANLSNARMERAELYQTHLEGASLFEAHLEGASLFEAHLEGADLRQAFFDTATNLSSSSLSGLGGFAQVADVRWGGVNLALLRGPLRPPIGDERIARAWKPKSDKKELASSEREQAEERIRVWQTAVRANRQFAVALQAQGMNEEAAQFFYHAQICQRTVLHLTGWRTVFPWLFSWILWALAGYGYKPGRTLLWYVGVILSFAAFYWGATHGVITFGLAPSQIQPLHWYEVLVLSVSSFHGRGFFQPIKSLGDPVAILAALEAICGLLIEVSFIATFTQRFFGSK